MKNLLIIFGGRSSEYEVSLRSAASVIRNVPKGKYNVLTLGITKDGKWLYCTADAGCIEDGSWCTPAFTRPAALRPDFGCGELLIFNDNGITREHVDVIFPVLHGKNGEDGTVQGLFKLCGIPYVGCGVLSSAMCMDKIITNTICDHLGVRQAKWASVTRRDYDTGCFDCAAVIAYLGLPLFVKPANAGSSVGITKVKSANELDEALRRAFENDSKALLEQNIPGRELECAVCGNDEPVASCVGEVVPCNDFYDYEAKYIDGDSELLIPAPLSEEKSAELRATALKVYKAMDCAGLARVDFFMTDSGDIYFNELNTIPGFTSISMYSMLFMESGVPYGELIDRLIAYAEQRKENLL